MRTVLLVLLLFPTALWGHPCDGINMFFTKIYLQDRFTDIAISEKTDDERLIQIYNGSTRLDLTNKYTLTILSVSPPSFRGNNMFLEANTTESWIRFRDLQYSDYVKRMERKGEPYSFILIIKIGDCTYNRDFTFSVFPNPPRIVSSDKIYITAEKGHIHTFKMNPPWTSIKEARIYSGPNNTGFINWKNQLVIPANLSYASQFYLFPIKITTTTNIQVDQSIRLYVMDEKPSLGDIIFWDDDSISVKEYQSKIDFHINRADVTITIDKCEIIECLRVDGHTVYFKPFVTGQDGSITITARYVFENVTKGINKQFQVLVQNVLDAPVWPPWDLKAIDDMTSIGFPAHSTIPIPRAFSPDNLPIVYYLTVNPQHSTEMFHLDESTGQLTCTKALPPGQYELTLTAETFPVSTDTILRFHLATAHANVNDGTGTIPTSTKAVLVGNVPHLATAHAKDDGAETVPAYTNGILVGNIPAHVIGDDDDAGITTTTTTTTPSNSNSALHLLWLLLPLIPLCAVTSYVGCLHFKFGLPIPKTLRDCKALYIDSEWRKYPKSTEEDKDDDECQQFPVGTTRSLVV